MARIDYSISVTAVGSGTVEGQTVEKIDSDLNRSLSCAKSDSLWDGTSVTGWSAGTCTYKKSRTNTNTVVVDSGAQGLWIKHTGFKYDGGLSTTAETTTIVIVSGDNGAAHEICRLRANEGIYLPSPKNQTITLTDTGGGEIVAVETAVLT
tara:strand:+ start:508 stop:960 length:453 start_codon:yes stop_codon:yes gene_type:complete